MTVLLPLLCLMISLNAVNLPVLLGSYELEPADISFEEFLSVNNKNGQTRRSLNPSDNNLQKKIVVISPDASKKKVSTSQQLIDNEEISSGFGKRTDPLNSIRKFHKGIDISRPTGTEVFAWNDGVVARSGWQRGYGLTVDIVHPNGIKTRYAHLKQATIHKGQKVSKGQILGRVGASGRTTGANLHFEVVVAGKLADPLNHLLEDDDIVGNGPIIMNNG